MHSATLRRATLTDAPVQRLPARPLAAAVASTADFDGKVVALHAPRAQTRAPIDDSSRQENGRLVRLFGVDLYDTTLVDAARWLVHRAALAMPTTAAFINAHCVNVMFDDVAYRNAVEDCDRLFADGSGTRIAARTVGVQLTDNVNGTDLFPVLCAEAARAGTRIYLLGGRDGVSERTARRMIQQFPDLAITGSASGYFIDAAEEERTIAAINASGAQIVLVGLGVPRQERWIARNRSKLRAPVLVGVGGLFDYYSGRLPRAPRALRKMGLEWTWRLAMEPRRLASRYLIGNARFLARLAWLHLLSPDDFDQSRVARR